ncbi:MAG TPA: TIM barrel protein [Flavitalea sp.]|nr:TIM barrel protein [Flavitalea sp.]
MNRRAFLAVTSQGIGAMTLPFINLPGFFKEIPMGVVVHSYGNRWHSKAQSQKYPGFADAIDLIAHCHQIGAGGVQVTVKGWTEDFAKKVRDKREKLGLYLEGSIEVPGRAEDIPLFEQEVVHAKEAGAVILRTVTSAGRRYEVFHSDQEVYEFKKKAFASLQLAEPVLRKHKVKLAVENHKDWRADELANALRELNTEWIGVTLDFGNSIALIEDPMQVIETLVPFSFSTHVKDIGLEEYTDGFLMSEVPLGKGFLDLPKIVALCKKHNRLIHFNLEMITRDPLKIPCLRNDYWASFEGVSGRELARALRMVKENKSESHLPAVSHLSEEGRLAVEEENVLECLRYSKDRLEMKG